MATEINSTEYGVNVGGRATREQTDGHGSWAASLFAAFFGRKLKTSNKVEKAVA